MEKPYQEWLKQADYDMDTAEYMFRGGRYFYSVFMCHLAVEKAIKGLFQAKLDKEPPKIHHLMQLLSGTGCVPPEKIERFLIRLNEASVRTRYPEDIAFITSQYTKSATKEILAEGKEVIKWIKQQF